MSENLDRKPDGDPTGTPEVGAASDPPAEKKSRKWPTIRSAARFFNRELSWLDFNARVLEEAGNTNHPLLERVRFLSISDNNLNEFFAVRVAGLEGQVRAGVTTRSDDGLTPLQQLRAVNERAAELMERQQATWLDLQELLNKAGIAVAGPDGPKRWATRSGSPTGCRAGARHCWSNRVSSPPTENSR